MLGHQDFQRVISRLYLRIGALYKELKPLAKTDDERNLLIAQLHAAREDIRELLDEVRRA